MHAGLRYLICSVAGLVAGAGIAWALAGQGMGRRELVNGSWSTSLSFGTKSTDIFTRASVARRGLLALPSSETVYWQASTDSEGRALDGNCTYAMTGSALDARWWSVTFYDTTGYLVANPANIWSFSGASISAAEQARWRVTIAPDKPPTGHWLPSAKGKPFHLTLRMYNPGQGFRESPVKAALPKLMRERCI